MCALLTKIILPILVLLLLGYSQELPKSKLIIPDMVGGPVGVNSPFRKPDIKGDTVRLRHDESYALFSGTFQKKINPFYVPEKEFKVRTVIRGDIDTTANNRSIIKIYGLICSDIKLEVNKDYLILNAIQHDNSRISPYISPLTKCEDIPPDTPENRQKLIEKYEEKIVIYKPKPAEK